MHYTQQDIIDRSHTLGSGWTKATVELGVGDTTESAVSTKWDYVGPGTVTYMIHASGWDVRPDDTVGRVAKRVNPAVN